MDLPSGTGFATGGITIGDDDRLYVAVGAPCNNCEFAEAERGAILSMKLDGSDRQVFASGFRNPADLAFYRDQLWTLDSAPRQTERNALDELNRLQAGGWYGFPYCLGVDTVNIESEARNCSDSIAPAMQFGSGAAPISLAAFPNDLLPGTEDTLIVVLSGDPSQVDFVGYKVIMITFDEADQPLGTTVILPFLYEGGRQAYLPYRGQGLFWEQFIHLSELGFGHLSAAAARSGCQSSRLDLHQHHWWTDHRLATAVRRARFRGYLPHLDADESETLSRVWQALLKPTDGNPRSENGLRLSSERFARRARRALPFGYNEHRI